MDRKIVKSVVAVITAMLICFSMIVGTTWMSLGKDVLPTDAQSNTQQEQQKPQSPEVEKADESIITESDKPEDRVVPVIKTQNTTTVVPNNTGNVINTGNTGSADNNQNGNTNNNAGTAVPDTSVTESIAGLVNSDSTLAQAVTMTSEEGIQATVPAGVKIDADALTLTITEKSNSDSDVELEATEKLDAYDVHIEGIAQDNTIPVAINLGEVLTPGLNKGNLALYHVENGETVKMTEVGSAADFTQHNQFAYNPENGELAVAMAGFSEVAVVSEEPKWEGNFDYSWYTNAVATADGKAVTEYIIANADQLAGFGAIVGGMNGQTRDSFAGKTVKLISDINLGYGVENHTYTIFNPIGYYYTDDNNADGTEGDYYSTVYSFEGTFNGNGHKIANFYQNTWEIKGDYAGNYYCDAMGLFGYVVNGTVKNLTVDNFSSDGEYTPTGVIAAYAVNSTFENIAITKCNPRVYNTGNGGIVGIGGNSDDPDTYKLTFTNITIDNTNKITALWGSWDVACGGLVGMFRGAGHVYMTNCHVAAQIDVYNDVCGNYQYYWYRYSGMMIGTNKNMTTDDKGYTVPETDKFHAENCTVHFGEWNDYYYCELVANSLASYTHDHQFSRLEQISSIDEIKSGDTWTKTGNFLLINGETKTCYHIVNKNGVLTQHNHDAAGEETVNGETVLKENNQIVYLPFNQLFTGYGWGVKHIPVYNGEDYAFDGITILDRTEANSVVKFDKADTDIDSYTTETTVTIGELFKAATIEDKKLTIKGDKVQVTVSPVGDGSTAEATYTANKEDWTKGTLTFSGIGAATITITDYYFCTPTTITITVKEREPEVKFDTNFTGDFLYRVGNIGTVKLDNLFKAKDGAEIGTVSVTVESVDGTAASGTYTQNATWTNGTIQFNGTGVVKVTITDNDYCTPTVLYLEVVDAVNATGATSATENNVVLLNDAGLSSLTVSGRYTFYGNGFTLTYTGNGQYLNNGLTQGVVTVSENGTLDNVRIKATIYPKAYMYYSNSALGDYVQGGPYSVEGDKKRYHYQLSAVAASGNATISNCYIYGGRNNIFVNTGDVTITDSILECGTVANVQIQSNSSHIVTLNNVTTIQHKVNATIVDTDNVMMGAGVIVGPETTSNPEIVLDGYFKQYNWVTAEDKDQVNDAAAKQIIKAAVDATAYNHTVDGKTASNLGIIYMNTEYATVTNNTTLPYKQGTITINGIDGNVYSLQGATAEQIYSDIENADRTTKNDVYKPQFKYPDDLGGQKIPEGGDEHLYREGDTIYVMFPSGDTKELDLVALVNIQKYGNQDLNLEISCKDENGNAVTVTDGKVSLSEAGEYTVTYTVTDTQFYDKNGNLVANENQARTKNSITYSWDVTISVSLKDTAVSDARFEFDATKQKMGYYVKSSLFSTSVYQYIPFLSGLKIYDYNGQTEYLRFDGDADFNKVASIELTNKYSGNDARVVVKLTDGGVIDMTFYGRADSSGNSGYTGSIKTKDNVVYYVTDKETGETDDTTVKAYWYVDYYKFTGNNGVTIQSGQQTFNSTGSSASTPSGNFGTTIKYTVTYDANEGNCGQTTGYATSAAAAVTLPTPTRSGYIFAGWYTAASGGTRVGGAGENYTPSGNITLYAQWGKPCTVTYNANGGSCGTDSEKYTGTALTLPTPTRDGYWFIGWYDAAEGGSKIGDAGAKYSPLSETTLYAHWQEQVKYIVTYNANGGTCGTASATYEGTSLTLPTPTRTGYKFLGWYTAASGGTRVGGAGESYTPSANITLYAQWERIAYTITVTTSNATVSGVTNGQTSYYSDTISITVSFSKNNSKTLTVKDASGNTVLSKSAAGTYTFTMPASNVTIEASSSGTCVTPDTLVTLYDGTTKRIDQVTYEDQLLVWDFYTGQKISAPSSIVMNHGEGDYEIVTVEFSDGTKVNTISGHGFYDADEKQFVIISDNNVADYIGHNFVKSDGTKVELVDYSIKTEHTESWSILTAVHYNCVMEGMWTLTPAEVENSPAYLMPFEIGEDMKFVEDKMYADIQEYGMYTYEEFQQYMTMEQFYAFNFPIFKVSVGKGYFTYEDILYLISVHFNVEIQDVTVPYVQAMATSIMSLANIDVDPVSTDSVPDNTVSDSDSSSSKETVEETADSEVSDTTESDDEVVEE